MKTLETILMVLAVISIFLFGILLPIAGHAFLVTCGVTCIVSMISGVLIASDRHCREYNAKLDAIDKKWDKSLNR